VRKTVELSGRAQNSAKCNLVWDRGDEQSFGRSTDQLNIPKPIRWHKRMCPAQTQIAAQKNSVLEAWRIRKAPTPPPQATTSDKTAFSDQVAFGRDRVLWQVNWPNPPTNISPCGGIVL